MYIGILAHAAALGYTNARKRPRVRRVVYPAALPRRIITGFRHRMVGLYPIEKGRPTE